MTTIFVGNLPNDINPDRAKNLFAAYGEVESINLTLGAPSRSHQGFGFVEMEATAASKAIEALDGTLFQGAILAVNEATEAQLAKQGASEASDTATRERDDALPSSLLRRTYQVASVVQVPDPAGAGADDWYRYELKSGPASITGFHRGTLEEVTAYAQECAESFNERNLKGTGPRPAAGAKRRK